MPVTNNIFQVSPGMAYELFIDKYSRIKEDGSFQSWQERISEVVEGNFTLDPRFDTSLTNYAKVKDYPVWKEYEITLNHAVKGIIATSGRHLQHGDAQQSNKIGELFTNCSTAVFSFLKFFLLLKGSGVGRSYDSDACWVDWDYMPNTRFVLSSQHPDYEPWIESLEEAQHKYDSDGENVRWFNVEDSAEGWVKVVTILETAAFHKNNKDHLFIFNLTPVRGRGTPIEGQQGRPASGPVPFIQSLQNVASVKGAGFKPWKQALFIDHYLSDCVRLGGIRRSARLAVKYWKDRDVIDFIDVKRGGWLHTANNSIAVDEEFWREAASPRPSHARRVFEAAVSAAYWDNTGEPGFINIDKLTWNDKNIENISFDNYLNHEYEESFGGFHHRTKKMMNYILQKSLSKKYSFICNPCVEIVLALYGGYCVHGDTRILHRNGSDKIKNLIGKEVEVWNGEKWSKVKPFQTAKGNQKLLRVQFSDGSHLDCTPYHRFSVTKHRQSTNFIEVEAKDLWKGAILPTFRVSNDIEGNYLEDAYTYGAFLGDGCLENRSDSIKPRYQVSLYNEKIELPVTGTRGTQYSHSDTCEAVRVTVSHLDHKKLHQLKEKEGLPNWVFKLDRESTLEFIRGWLDTDGCLDKSSRGLRISTTHHQKAVDLQLLLRRIGISFATITIGAKAGSVNNFGVRKSTIYNVGVPQSEAAIINGYRVFTDAEINLNKTVKQQRIVNITPIEGKNHDTYCFTEKERGMGVFNNVLTYQCIVGDACLMNADTENEAIEAVSMMGRMLVRTNLMKFLYEAEVKRTNRIGISLIGIHEFAAKMYDFNFYDLINENKSTRFWSFIRRMRNEVQASVDEFCDMLGLERCHTYFTLKPAGTVAKVMSCTEAANLPSMPWYLRYVQFKSDHPLLDEYRRRGYPVKDISKNEVRINDRGEEFIVNGYKDTFIVGFPTKLSISDMLGDRVVCAGDITVEQHYLWLQLLEKHWLGEGENNQISYTLKYDPKKTSYEEFMQMILKYQPTIRCCSVMPQIDGSAYIYTPEERISKEQYDRYMENIRLADREAVDDAMLDCASGACGVDLSRNSILMSPNGLSDASTMEAAE